MKKPSGSRFELRGGGSRLIRLKSSAYTLSEIIIVMLIISVIVGVTIGVTKAKLDKITNYTYTNAYLTLRDVTRNILGDFQSEDEDYVSLDLFSGDSLLNRLIYSLDSFAMKFMPSVQAKENVIYYYKVPSQSLKYIPGSIVATNGTAPTTDGGTCSFEGASTLEEAQAKVRLYGSVEALLQKTSATCRTEHPDYQCPGLYEGKPTYKLLPGTKCGVACGEGSSDKTCGPLYDPVIGCGKAFALSLFQVYDTIFFPPLANSISELFDLDFSFDHNGELIADSRFASGFYCRYKVTYQEPEPEPCPTQTTTTIKQKYCQGLEYDDTPGVCEWKSIEGWSKSCPEGQEWYSSGVSCGCQPIPEPEPEPDPCVTPSSSEQTYRSKCLGMRWNNTPGVCKWQSISGWKYNCPDGYDFYISGSTCGCEPIACTEPSASEKTSQYCQGLQWNNTPGVCSWENIPNWPPACPETEEWNYSVTDCRCIPTPRTLPRRGANLCKMFAERTNTKSGTTDCSGSSISVNTTDFQDKKADLTLRNGMLVYNLSHDPSEIAVLSNNKQGGSYAGVPNTNSYGYTVYVDINGKSGDSKLWEDVYPFYITMSGFVIPGYDKTANPAGSGGDSVDHMQVSVESEIIDYNGVRKLNWVERSVPFQLGACRAGYVGSDTPYCNGVFRAASCSASNSSCRLKYISPVKFF